MRYLAAILIFTLIPNFAYSQTFYGVWTVTAIQAEAMTSISRQEAEQFIGHKLEFSEKIAKHENVICENVKYNSEIYNVDDLMFSYRVSISKIGTAIGKITHIDVLCNGAAWSSFGHLLLYNPPNELTVVLAGYFFKLERDPANN